MGWESVGLEDQLRRLTTIKHGPNRNTGWGTDLRLKFGHSTPDDYYESCVESLVDDRTEWIDVGGGKTIFPAIPGWPNCSSNVAGGWLPWTLPQMSTKINSPTRAARPCWKIITIHKDLISQPCGWLSNMSNGPTRS